MQVVLCKQPGASTWVCVQDARLPPWPSSWVEGVCRGGRRAELAETGWKWGMLLGLGWEHSWEHTLLGQMGPWGSKSLGSESPSQTGPRAGVEWQPHTGTVRGPGAHCHSVFLVCSQPGLCMEREPCWVAGLETWWLLQTGGGYPFTVGGTGGRVCQWLPPYMHCLWLAPVPAPGWLWPVGSTFPAGEPPFWGDFYLLSPGDAGIPN